MASVPPTREGGYRRHLNALKMWQTKNAPAVSIRQGKRFAERWCTAKLYPELLLREAVVRLTDNTPIEPKGSLPGLPPTREQQRQAERLGAAAAGASATVMAALEPQRPASMTPPTYASEPSRKKLAGLEGG